jgi:hypothetical protein
MCTRLPRQRLGPSRGGARVEGEPGEGATGRGGPVLAGSGSASSARPQVRAAVEPLLVERLGRLDASDQAPKFARHGRVPLRDARPPRPRLAVTYTEIPISFARNWNPEKLGVAVTEELGSAQQARDRGSPRCSRIGIATSAIMTISRSFAMVAALLKCGWVCRARGAFGFTRIDRESPMIIS